MEKRFFVAALAAVSTTVAAVAGTADRLASLRTKGVEEGLTLAELREVRDLLRPSAESGDVEAQIGLANSYLYTEIGRESRRLKGQTPPFKEFACSDYYFDYYFHGGTTTNAVETLQDPVEAQKWYRRAADAGSRRAMLFLAVALAGNLKESQAARDQWLRPGTESRKWMEKAARGGSALACYVLFEKAEDAMTDEERLYWLRKGAGLGSPGMLAELAFAYAEGRFELPKSQTEARDYLRKAAGKGFKPAISKMPYACLETGLYDEALAWFDKAGDDRSAYVAEKALKKCSEEGKTSHVLQWALRLDALRDEKSRSDSRQSESRRAERAKVQHTIATIYHWGAREQGADGEWTDTVKANVAEAMKWYRKAAGNGDYESIFALCEYYTDHNNLAEAVKWLKRGEKIDGEHKGRIKYMLFECLLTRDQRMGSEANRLLEEAAALGEPEAVKMLNLRDEAKARKRQGTNR